MEFTTIADAKKQTNLSYLGNINTSAKLKKNKTADGQYTYAIYLAPAKQSGYNVCPFSTPECRKGCLATSGRAGMEIKAGKTKTADSRIKKSKLFFEHREFFMDWLIAEIKNGQKRAIKDGYHFSVRLNVTSDIDWANIIHKGQNIFEIFPDINFYDYTKQFSKFNNIIPNYHLTYSYTGRNWKQSEELLKRGFNIAVIFNVKNEIDLPETWRGYKVINGDRSDFRPSDGNGVIVGLKWKNIGNVQLNNEIKNSIFVVQPVDFESNNVRLQTAAAGM